MADLYSVTDYGPVIIVGGIAYERVATGVPHAPDNVVPSTGYATGFTYTYADEQSVSSYSAQRHGVADYFYKLTPVTNPGDKTEIDISNPVPVSGVLRLWKSSHEYNVPVHVNGIQVEFLNVEQVGQNGAVGINVAAGDVVSAFPDELETVSGIIYPFVHGA